MWSFYYWLSLYVSMSIVVIEASSVKNSNNITFSRCQGDLYRLQSKLDGAQTEQERSVLTQLNWFIVCFIEYALFELFLRFFILSVISVIQAFKPDRLLIWKHIKLSLQVDHGAGEDHHPVQQAQGGLQEAPRGVQYSQGKNEKSRFCSLLSV